MQTALDLPTETLSSYEQKFIAKVREFGWFGTSVFGDAEGPGFSYTTGFWLNTTQPELIMFGVNSDTAHNVFWDMFRDASAGDPLPVGTSTDRVFGNLRAYGFPVAKRFYPEYLGSSLWFYGSDDFPCHQVVWPDRSGVFPWEEGFDPAFANDQPDLTEHGWRAALTS